MQPTDNVQNLKLHVSLWKSLQCEASAAMFPEKGQN
jgi:hypothetical protein